MIATGSSDMSTLGQFARQMTRVFLHVFPPQESNNIDLRHGLPLHL